MSVSVNKVLLEEDTLIHLPTIYGGFLGTAEWRLVSSYLLFVRYDPQGHLRVTYQHEKTL